MYLQFVCLFSVFWLLFEDIQADHGKDRALHHAHLHPDTTTLSLGNVSSVVSEVLLRPERPELTFFNTVVSRTDV